MTDKFLESTNQSSSDFNFEKADYYYINTFGDTMTGNLNMNNNLISNLRSPVNENDAISKNYLVKEINKLKAEQDKLKAEQDKLKAEQDKLKNDSMFQVEIFDNKIISGDYIFLRTSIKPNFLWFKIKLYDKTKSLLIYVESRETFQIGEKQNKSDTHYGLISIVSVSYDLTMKNYVVVIQQNFYFYSGITFNHQNIKDKLEKHREEMIIEQICVF